MLYQVLMGFRHSLTLGILAASLSAVKKVHLSPV